MRGTDRPTNKALSNTILLMGCERLPFFVAALMWGVFLFSTFGHWTMIFGLVGFAVTIFALKFLARIDPQAMSIFKMNSRFILQNRFYPARGFPGTFVERQPKSIN